MTLAASIDPPSASRPIVFVDGACALCSRSAQLIAALDRTGAIALCPVQSPRGRAMFAELGLDADAPETWVYWDGARAHTHSDAIIELGRRLGGLARAAELLRLLPRLWRDGIYLWVARNRYRWFGRAQLCAAPSPRLRARLLTD